MRLNKRKLMLLTAVVVSLGVSGTVRAHCDSLDGPVIADARAALQAGRIDSVLKWIGKADEASLRKTFERTLKVRKLGPEAREIADTHLFETLVRIHRAGEGAPYTGLTPAGSIAPPIRAADRALESGSVDALVDSVTAKIARELRERFEKAHAARAKKDQSAEKGRAYVARYVDFVHYVEAIHHAGHHEEAH
jgi:hypothetical protein